MDSIILSMVYEHIEDNWWEIDSQELKSWRDRKRKKEYGNMSSQQPDAVLDDAEDWGRIKDRKRIHYSDYTYQENTIVDLRGFTYEAPWIIRAYNSWMWEAIIFWHAISIVWEVEEYYIGLSDIARGHKWYVLIAKDVWYYYVYEL